MVQTDIVTRQVVYFHTETTNQSFIDMHYILKDKGIKNNKFFLILYDTDLIGVDPRDPNLSPILKMKILKECMANYWYFIREVVRIPDQGGSITSGARYKLNRANLAMNFLFMFNYNMFVEMPRQHGKTTAALCRYLWIFNFGSTNSEIMFIHKNHDGSKGNLQSLKHIRDLLPSYLSMKSAIAPDGKKMRVSNSVETLQNPINLNKIKTLPSARNKALANGLGRGCTMPLHYYDEFAFILHNNIIYTAATPAYSTAAKNAKRNNAPYGILLTTTPGDLTTNEGNYAYDVRNSATPWSELYYDYNYEQLEELKNSNTNSTFFYIRYTYQQLGSGADYFKQMVKDMLKDWPAIRREVLLEWSKTATNCPFKKEDLDVIGNFCKEPIRTILFGRAGQYQFNVYEDIDLRYPPIIGVDVSGAMYQDSSAITVIDSRTTKVCATLNCNYIPSDDLAEVIYNLVTNYMRNAIVNVERNGGFGASVLQRLVKTSIKNNLYYEVKDKVLEEKSNGIHTVRNAVKVKVYGTDSTREVRKRMIELLFERVNYHKDKFIAPIIHDEMEAMEVKKNGKVEHSSNSHDDQVFSYLMAIYVWYDGQDLMQRYNIQKNSLTTDEDLEEAFIRLEDYDSDGTVEIDLDSSDAEDLEMQEQIKFISEGSKAINMVEFEARTKESDDQCLKALVSVNKATLDAYNKKYHIDDSVPTMDGNNPISNGTIKLPDSMFDMDYDQDEYQYSIYAGNLGDKFAGISIDEL